MSDSAQWEIRELKPAVCRCFPFGRESAITVHLTAWPSRWKRFWMFLFFGWRFEKMP